MDVWGTMITAAEDKAIRRQIAGKFRGAQPRRVTRHARLPQLLSLFSPKFTTTPFHRLGEPLLLSRIRQVPRCVIHDTISQAAATVTVDCKVD
jgi:hypothetical protein